MSAGATIVPPRIRAAVFPLAVLLLTAPVDGVVRSALLPPPRAAPPRAAPPSMCAPALVELPSFKNWMETTNAEREDVIAAVARAWSPAREDDTEYIQHAEIVEVDAEHIELMEVLCSSQDDRCIAISVPIQFETPIQTPDELEAAFRALADKADDARREADPDALPRKAEEQCAQLQGLLALLNRDFESHLRYFALVYAKECLREEELERANLVVLTYEGLTLELLSRDLVTQSRRLSEVSILFSKSCANADEVEGEIVEMARSATPQASAMS